MNKLNPTKFALAAGLSSVIAYISCVLLMALVGEEGVVRISNLLFHGMEFTGNIRMDIPLTDNLLGIVMSFVFWGIMGFIISSIYNKLINSNA